MAVHFTSIMVCEEEAPRVCSPFCYGIEYNLRSRCEENIYTAEVAEGFTEEIVISQV